MGFSSRVLSTSYCRHVPITLKGRKGKGGWHLGRFVVDRRNKLGPNVIWQDNYFPIAKKDSMPAFMLWDRNGYIATSLHLMDPYVIGSSGILYNFHRDCSQSVPTNFKKLRKWFVGFDPVGAEIGYSYARAK